MPAELLVGVDVGTTGAKAIVCDRAGTVLAQAGVEYRGQFAGTLAGGCRCSGGPGLSSVDLDGPPC
jgi:hypothetical protein